MTELFYIALCLCFMWALCSGANLLLCKAIFATADRALRLNLVILGPFGTALLATRFLLTAGDRFVAFSTRHGKRLSSIGTPGVLGLVLLPWFGSGIANYIWYERHFTVGRTNDPRRDVLILLGPIGSVVLLLMTVGQFFGFVWVILQTS